MSTHRAGGKDAPTNCACQGFWIWCRTGWIFTIIPKENIVHKILQMYFTYHAVEGIIILAGCLAGATPCANELPHALSWTGAETLHVSKGRVIRLHMPAIIRRHLTPLATSSPQSMQRMCFLIPSFLVYKVRDSDIDFLPLISGLHFTPVKHLPSFELCLHTLC